MLNIQISQKNPLLRRIIAQFAEDNIRVADNAILAVRKIAFFHGIPRRNFRHIQNSAAAESDFARKPAIFDQIIQSIQCDNLSLPHDCDSVAQIFRFIHEMRCHANGYAGFLQTLDFLPNIASRLGIQTCSQLVQEHDLRFPHQSQNNRQFLTLTAGQFVHIGVLLLLKSEILQQSIKISRVVVKTFEQFAQLAYLNLVLI